MNDCSFGREFRLHYRWEFLKFFEGAEVCRLPYALIFRIPNQIGHFRLGVTLKLRTNSIQRNSLKRQIRESFRIHREVLGAFDYNVVVGSQKSIDYRFSRKFGQEFRERLPYWSREGFRKSTPSTKNSQNKIKKSLGTSAMGQA